jgi:hypothetical protein
MQVSLGRYGYSFQCKVVSALITDRRFCTLIAEILDPVYFDSEALQWTVRTALDFFRQHRGTPTIDVFRIHMHPLPEALKVEVVGVLKSAHDALGSSDLELIKEQTVDFCQTQVIKRAIEQSTTLINDGRKDEALKLIEEAGKAGQDGDLGYDYLGDIDRRYVKKEFQAIPTAWPVLNALMKKGAGLPKRKFGLVMAPSGVGKTWVLVAMGAHALKAGYTVLHYTLELDEDDVALRYDSTLTSIGMDELDTRVEDIKDRLAQYPGKLYIKEYPEGQLSIEGLRASIERHRMMGINPDVVIVDYLDLMAVPYSSAKRTDEQLGELSKDLKGIAKTEDVALWSATQTNRGGLAEEVIRADKMAGGYSKTFSLDFGISVSRPDELAAINAAIFYIFKSRIGPDKISFMALMDTRYGLIELMDMQSDEANAMREHAQEQVEVSKGQVRDKFSDWVSSKKNTASLNGHY